MGKPFRHRLRVRYHECDPQGVVFNANYLAYHDIAVTELWREAFGSWDAFVAEHGIDMVVAEATVRYLAPLGFDEEFDVSVAVRRLGTTSLAIASRLERDDRPVAEVELAYVVVDPESRAKTPIPDPIRTALERYAS